MNWRHIWWLIKTWRVWKIPFTGHTVGWYLPITKEPKYHFCKWLHWKFGIHFFEPLGSIGVLKHEENGRYVWCRYCGSKFEAHDYLWEKLYK